MFTSKSTDHLAFVSRQLSKLLDEQPLDSALQKLKDASPDQYDKDIDHLRLLLSGAAPDENRSLGPTPYATFEKLLPSVGGQQARFFQQFVAYVQQSRVVFETYWAGVMGLVSYLAALSVVTLVVAVIFSAFVVPSFSNMFAQVGAQLPGLTKNVFAFRTAGLPLLAIVLLAIIGVVLWFVVLFHRRIERFAPLPNWPKWAPVVGGIAESYNLGLFINFVRMLRACDVDPARAVDVAAKASNQSAGLSLDALAKNAGDFEQFSTLTELAVAASLGNFDSEITHQCDQHLGRLSLELIEARDRFSLALKLILYVFVATLIVAMYLPIFKLGSVV